MNIQHDPLFDTAKVEKLYTEKDGVEVKYVCTTAIQEHAEWAADVFYRATPHPQFGNRYFALYYSPMSGNLMITNADRVEDFEFGMIEDADGKYYYSQHRHDYKVIEDKMIDGGRSYIRKMANL
jgi:hypothetical protein